MLEAVECPFCYNSPAIVCCALCGSTGKVMKEAADEYRKIEDPTVEDRLKIRNKYGYRVVG
jgi:hypothetical protein